MIFNLEYIDDLIDKGRTGKLIRLIDDNIFNWSIDNFHTIMDRCCNNYKCFGVYKYMMDESTCKDFYELFYKFIFDDCNFTFGCNHNIEFYEFYNYDMMRYIMERIDTGELSHFGTDSIEIKCNEHDGNKGYFKNDIVLYLISDEYLRFNQSKGRYCFFDYEYEYKRNGYRETDNIKIDIDKMSNKYTLEKIYQNFLIHSRQRDVLNFCSY